MLWSLEPAKLMQVQQGQPFMQLTHEQIEDIVCQSKPKCPKCNSKLECFFHERDSTSNHIRCKKCHWYANTDWNGNWGGLEI